MNERLSENFVHHAVFPGDWTSVIGEMEGTFTNPCPVPNSAHHDLGWLTHAAVADE